MFEIHVYNVATGNYQTVSGKIPDITDGEGNNLNREVVASGFARQDTNTDHVYYAVTVD